MKYILSILSVIGFALLMLVAWNNPSVSMAFLVPLVNVEVATTSFVYAMMFSVCGFVAGAMFVGAFLVAQKDKINPYKRQLEKMSVQNDSDSSRVAVLEAKVKTLETALQKALGNK